MVFALSDADAPGPTAVRWLRQRRALTQAELSLRSGVSIRTIRALERGQIAEPRRGSLEALADAIALTPGERLGFLDSWYETSTRVAAGRVWKNDTLDGALEAARLTHQVGLRTHRLSSRAIVNGDRLIEREEVEVTVEARARGVDSYLYLARGDQGSDARLYRTRPVRGCTIERDEVVTPADGVAVSAVLLGLGDPMRAREVRTFRFVIDQLALAQEAPWVEVRAGLEDSDCMAAGSMSPLAQLHIEVTFEGQPPARIWEIRADGFQPVRLRPVEPDSWGSVTVVRNSPEPGSWGFEWEWQDRP